MPEQFWAKIYDIIKDNAKISKITREKDHRGRENRTPLNAEFKIRSRRNKEMYPSNQCREIKDNDRKGRS